MEEIKKFNKIEKKLFEVGFDEFYQAGSKSIFHPLNIVATSKILNKQFWICVSGGYRCENTFHISFRELNNIKANSDRIDCKNQSDMVDELNNIKLKITNATIL